MHARLTRTFAIGCLAALAAPVCTAAAGAAQPAARHHDAPEPVLRLVAVKHYGHVLADAHGHTLYLLSAEAGSKVVCKGACLKIWPPLLVPSHVHHLRVAAEVKGRIGFVARTRTRKQVTLNGYPLYTFAGDKKPAETNGEGITHFRATWILVRPGPTKPAATRVPPSSTKSAPATSSRSKGGSSGSGW